jgi:hypothetical protein
VRCEGAVRVHLVTVLGEHQNPWDARLPKASRPKKPLPAKLIELS